MASVVGGGGGGGEGWFGMTAAWLASRLARNTQASEHAHEPRPPPSPPTRVAPHKESHGASPAARPAGSFTISCTMGRLSASRPAALPRSTAAICASKASTTRPSTFSTTPAHCSTGAAGERAQRHRLQCGPTPASRPSGGAIPRPRACEVSGKGRHLRCPAQQLLNHPLSGQRGRQHGPALGAGARLVRRTQPCPRLEGLAVLQCGSAPRPAARPAGSGQGRMQCQGKAAGPTLHSPPPPTQYLTWS